MFTYLVSFLWLTIYMFDAYAMQYEIAPTDTSGAPQVIQARDTAADAHLQHLLGHDARIISVYWSSDARLAALYASVGTVSLYNAHTNQIDCVLSDQPGSINKIVWSPNALYIAISSENRIDLWETASGRLIQTIETTFSGMMAWSPDSEQFAYRQDATTVQIKNLASGFEQSLAHTVMVKHIMWINSQELLTGTSESLFFWDSKGDSLGTIHTPISLCRISPDGKYIATVDNNHISLWGQDTKVLLCTYEDTQTITVLSWSSDSNLLAIGCENGDVCVWNRRSGTIALRGTSHRLFVSGLAWSPRNQYLISTGADDKAYIWDVFSQKVYCAIECLRPSINQPLWHNDAIVLSSTSIYRHGSHAALQYSNIALSNSAISIIIRNLLAQSYAIPFTNAAGLTAHELVESLIDRLLPNLDLDQLLQEGRMQGADKRLLLKHYYLKYGVLFEAAAEEYEFSIQELLDHGKIAITTHDGKNILELTHRYISSLEGLQNIPGQETVCVIELGHNRISQIERRFFAGYSSCTHLELSCTNIQEFPADVFDTMPLQQLDMRSCKIESISPEVCRKLIKIASLMLARNPIASDGSIINSHSICMSYVYSQRNRYEGDALVAYDRELSQVAKEYYYRYDRFPEELAQVHYSFTIKDLFDHGKLKITDERGNKTLNLEKLHITSLDGLQSVPNADEIVTLKLGNNRISEVERRFFQNFSRLRYLDLSHNNLRKLPRDVFQDLSLEYLSLASCNLCDMSPELFCELRQIPTLLLQANHMIIAFRTTDGIIQFFLREYLDKYVNNHIIYTSDAELIDVPFSATQLSILHHLLYAFESDNILHAEPHIIDVHRSTNKELIMSLDIVSLFKLIHYFDMPVFREWLNNITQNMCKNPLAVFQGPTNARRNVVERSLYAFDSIRLLTCSPDERNIVALSVTNRAWKALYPANTGWIVNIETGKALELEQGPSGKSLETIQSLAYSSDGTRIIGPSGIEFSAYDTYGRLSKGIREEEPRMWDSSGKYIGTVINREVIRTPQVTGKSSMNYPAAMSPDGRTVVTGSNGRVLVWDNEKHSFTRVLDDAGGAQSIRYSPDGKYIVTSRLGDLYLWDVQTGNQLYISYIHPWKNRDEKYELMIGSPSIRGNHISRVNFSPGGKYIVTVTANGNYIPTVNGRRLALVWNSHTKALIRKIDIDDADSSVAISPNNKYLLSADSEYAYIYDINTGKFASNLRFRDRMDVLSADFSSNGRDVILRTSYKVFQYALSKILKGQEGEFIETNVPNEIDYTKITSVAYSPDRKHIVNASGDLARVWHVDTGTCICMFVGHSGTINKILYSPDGKYIITGSSDSKVYIWNAQNGELLHTLTETTFLKDLSYIWAGYIPAIKDIVWSPTGKYIITGSSDNTVRVWLNPIYSQSTDVL